MRDYSLAILPIAVKCDSTYLISADGLPVWPLCNHEDLHAIERLAQVFSRPIERVEATPGLALQLFNENVVALGVVADDSARLYAHLTRRELRRCENLNALIEIGLPTVVVTTPEHLTTELLDWLYSQNGEVAPGIICADVKSLRRQVLVRAAAVCLRGPLSLVSSELYPTIPMVTVRGEGFDIFGSVATVAERRSALGSGAGVLTVMTHSDGVDAFLGPDLSLCGMGETTGDAGLSTMPRCRLTNICHRHTIPVSEAVNSEAILSPEQIAARIFVWDVCFGIMPVGSIVDPRWGIGVRLVNNPSIGAILTSWQITLSSPEYARRVSIEIESGVPVGVALARFNDSQDSRDHHHRMCLFGDPWVQLPCAPIRKSVSIWHARRLSYISINELKQLAFLRLCMADAKLNAPNGPHSAYAATALQAIDNFEAAAYRGVPLEVLEPETGADMRDAVLQYALSRGKMLENWMPFTRHLRATSSRLCPICGRQADTLITAMRPKGVDVRRLTICALCGVLEDVPSASTIGFRLEGRILSLQGELPHERWAAGVLIASSDPADSVHQIWPAQSDGKPAHSVELPPIWPLGPVRISLVMVWAASFAVISRMSRGPSAV